MPDISDWDLELARELEPSLGKAMLAGAVNAQSKVVGITVNWTLQNPKAQEFLRKHALELARGINKTTKERIKQALLTGMQLGEGRDKLANRVYAVMQDAETWRAKLIAQTETMTAYNEGELQLYKEGNIKRKKWLGGQPGICPECDGLSGHVVDINDTFPGGYDAPPAHPGCRCALAGVVE